MQSKKKVMLNSGGNKVYKNFNSFYQRSKFCD